MRRGFTGFSNGRGGLGKEIVGVAGLGSFGKRDGGSCAGRRGALDAAAASEGRDERCLLGFVWQRQCPGDLGIERGGIRVRCENAFLRQSTHPVRGYQTNWRDKGG